MTDCAFVIPGDINLPTGGYAYDRRVLELLPSCGIRVRHVALADSFPAPTAADLEATALTLAALPADTVLLFDGLAYGALPEPIGARIRQPIVALCHHPLALETGVAPARAAKLKTLETAALARARAVVVTSAPTRETLISGFGLAGDRITVAEPGTDRAARVAAWRGGAVEMLAVGSVVPRKGYGVLIEALAGLAREHARSADWRLGIAGSLTRCAETVAALREQIARHRLDDRISLAGAVESDALDRLYARAHLFLMPSLYEGYGMALAEALVRGLPIITTTGGAAAKLVPDGAGLKVPPGDAAALRGALHRVLGEPSLLAGLAQAAYAAGRRLPQWQDTARIIAAVLERVGGRSGR